MFYLKCLFLVGISKYVLITSWDPFVFHDLKSSLCDLCMSALCNVLLMYFNQCLETLNVCRHKPKFTEIIFIVKGEGVRGEKYFFLIAKGSEKPKTMWYVAHARHDKTLHNVLIRIKYIKVKILYVSNGTINFNWTNRVP